LPFVSFQVLQEVIESFIKKEKDLLNYYPIEVQSKKNQLNVGRLQIKMRLRFLQQLACLE